jgi:Rrf2 family protein
MSHISTGVEYGLHCLLYLARLPPNVSQPSVRDLAELQGVPLEYAAKLFTRLQKAGIVVATQGVKGGFALARTARKISVLDVVTAIDGNKPLFECREIRLRCAIFDEAPPQWAANGVCSIHAVMQTAEARMRETLAAASLADLASQVSAKAPRSFDTKVVRWLENKSTGRRIGREASGSGT